MKQQPVEASHTEIGAPANEPCRFSEEETAMLEGRDR